MRPSTLVRGTLPILVLVTAVSAQAFSTSTESPVSVLEEARASLGSLAEKQRSAPVIFLDYESRAFGADGNPMPAVDGSLIADGTGRFRLEHARGIVVSDGETLWQYSSGTGQVIVRDTPSGGRGEGAAGGALLRFFDARAVAATREPGGDVRILLDPASVGEHLDSLVITLARDGSTVRRVETEDPAGNRVEYRVKSLRRDSTAPEGTFVFEAPADAETVDMR